MINEHVIREMAARIAEIKAAAAELKSLAGSSFPAVERNSDRILASTKMLELAVTDVIELS